MPSVAQQQQPKAAETARIDGRGIYNCGVPSVAQYQQ